TPLAFSKRRAITQNGQNLVAYIRTRATLEPLASALFRRHRQVRPGPGIEPALQWIDLGVAQFLQLGCRLARHRAERAVEQHRPRLVLAEIRRALLDLGERQVD